MLEHVGKSHGNQYLNEIKKKFRTFYEDNLEFLIKVCHLNDKYGKTVKCNFKNFTICSPSNLRYILQSLLILEHIKKNNLNNVNIIEIGGGYGGLCLFVYKIAELYKININSYVIFDLPEASKLQKIYLDSLNIKNVECYQLDNFKDLEKDSFLVSTYAFSEIPISIQKEYISKIINPYTNFGFIAWNNIPVYDFVKDSIIEKEKEYPVSGHNNNYYVKFYPKSL